MRLSRVKDARRHDRQCWWAQLGRLASVGCRWVGDTSLPTSVSSSLADRICTDPTLQTDGSSAQVAVRPSAKLFTLLLRSSALQQWQQRI